MDKKEKDFRRAGSFSIAEREAIIKDYLSSGLTKSEIWNKYTGSSQEHGNINRWMLQLGMEPSYLKYDFRREKKVSFVVEIPQILPKEEKSPEELRKELETLKKELETTKLKAEGYELMIEIAEKELKIPIRKKSNTK